MEFTVAEDCQRCGAALTATVLLPEGATHFYTACPGCGVLAINDVDPGEFYTGTVVYDPHGRSPRKRSRRA